MLIPFSDQGRQSKCAITRSNEHTYEQCLPGKHLFTLLVFVTWCFKAKDEYFSDINKPKLLETCCTCLSVIPRIIQFDWLQTVEAKRIPVSFFFTCCFSFFSSQRRVRTYIRLHTQGICKFRSTRGQIFLKSVGTRPKCLFLAIFPYRSSQQRPSKLAGNYCVISRAVHVFMNEEGRKCNRSACSLNIFSFRFMTVLKLLRRNVLQQTLDYQKIPNHVPQTGIASRFAQEDTALCSMQTSWIPYRFEGA